MKRGLRSTGETENSGARFDVTWKKGTRPVTERITDEEEEEDEEKKKREAEQKNRRTFLLRTKKHATKSQQHRERLKKTSERERVPTGIAQSRRGRVTDNGRQSESDDLSRGGVVEDESSADDRLYREKVEGWSQKTGGDFRVDH